MVNEHSTPFRKSGRFSMSTLYCCSFWVKRQWPDQSYIILAQWCTNRPYLTSESRAFPQFSVDMALWNRKLSNFIIPGIILTVVKDRCVCLVLLMPRRRWQVQHHSLWNHSFAGGFIYGALTFYVMDSLYLCFTLTSLLLAPPCDKTGQRK